MNKFINIHSNLLTFDGISYIIFSMDIYAVLQLCQKIITSKGSFWVIFTPEKPFYYDKKRSKRNTVGPSV